MLNLSNAGGFDWTHYSFDVAATGDTTALEFVTRQDPAYYRLDNISVGGAVPEPATWVSLIAGFGLLGMALRRRRVTVPA